MQVLPNQWSDLVTLRLSLAAWRWLRGHDLRLPCATATLLVHIWLLLLYVRRTLLWLSLIRQGDPYPPQQSHGWTLLLSLLAAVIIALAGVSCFVVVLATLRLHAIQWSPLLSAALKWHTLLLAAALIAVTGLYVYSDGMLAMVHKRFFPHSMILAVATFVAVLCCLQPPVRDRISSRLAVHLPLLHSLTLTVMFCLYYESTVGNVVDVVR